MNINLSNYITLSPQGLPIKSFIGNAKTTTEIAAANIHKYVHSVIQDTLQGPLSFHQSGMTAALYKNYLDCFTKDSAAHILLKKMRQDPSYAHALSIIDEGIEHNPNKEVPFDLWHNHMCEFTRKKILPQDYNTLPEYVEIFNNTYPNEKAAILSSSFLNDDTFYAGRLPTAANLIEKFNAKTKACNNYRVITLKTSENPDYIQECVIGLARMRYKSEEKPKDTSIEEKNQAIKSRVTDIYDMLSYPNTVLRIAYGQLEDENTKKAPKPVSFMISRDNQIQYFCTTAQGGTLCLWQDFFANNPDITSVTAPLVESSYAKHHLTKIGFTPPNNDATAATNTWTASGNALVAMKKKCGPKV